MLDQNLCLGALLITANSQMLCCSLTFLALVPQAPVLSRTAFDATGVTPSATLQIFMLGVEHLVGHCPCMQDMHTLESRQTARLSASMLLPFCLPVTEGRVKLLCDHLYSTEQLCWSQSGARHTIKEAVLCTAKSCAPIFIDFF